MKKQIKNNVSWVGKVDWELRKFHGNEYSTHKGSTYKDVYKRQQLVVGITREGDIVVKSARGRMYAVKKAADLEYCLLYTSRCV